MIGTHSVLDASLLGADTEETRTAGVGYRPGESYAKWGRFACDVPSYRLPGGLAHAKPGLNFAPPPPASDFSERRVQPSTGDPAIDEAAENTVRSNDDGSGSTQESSSRRTPGDGRKQRFSDAREHRPPFGRGIPTYLQVRAMKRKLAHVYPVKDMSTGIVAHLPAASEVIVALIFPLGIRIRTNHNSPRVVCKICITDVSERHGRIPGRILRGMAVRDRRDGTTAWNT